MQPNRSSGNLEQVVAAIHTGGGLRRLPVGLGDGAKRSRNNFNAALAVFSRRALILDWDYAARKYQELLRMVTV